MTVDLSDFEKLALIARRQPGKLEKMTADERKAYDREIKARSRAAQKAAAEEGNPKVTVDLTRDLLADIALMMLAADAPGADTIMKGLQGYFKGRTGFPAQIRHKAKTRKLKTKVIV